jgi:threonyl-tRNA synthetase
MLVVGGREKGADTVAVRLHGKGNQGTRPRAEAIAEILQAIRERRA